MRIVFFIFAIFYSVMGTSVNKIHDIDSIIYFRFPKDDTSGKTPYKKITIQYNAAQELAGKKEFLWDSRSRIWRLKDSIVFQRLGNDFLAFNYLQVEDQKCKLVGKSIYYLDKKALVTKVEFYDTDAKGIQIQPKEINHYTYLKDTIQAITVYKKGTITYKSLESNFQYSKNQIKIKSQEWGPLESNPIKKTVSWSMLNNKGNIHLDSMIFEYPKSETIKTRYQYADENVPIQKQLFMVKKNKSKDSLIETTQWFYNKQRHLISMIKAKTNDKGSIIDSQDNEIIYYFGSENLTMLPQKKFRYTIEYFLY